MTAAVVLSCAALAASEYLNAGERDVIRLEFACSLRYPSGFTLDAAFTTRTSVTVLSGPSGSGKTTILSILAGLRRPDRGRIRLDSTVLFDSDCQEWTCRRSPGASAMCSRIICCFRT